MSYIAHDGSNRGWLSSGKQYEEDFAKYGDIEGLTPGVQYDGGYQVIAVNPNQPDWGKYVPKGYEKVYWEPDDSAGGLQGSGGPGARMPSNESQGPGKMLIRKVASTAPSSAAPEKEDNTDYYAQARQLAGRYQANSGGGGSYAGGFQPIKVGGGPEDYDKAAAQGTYNSIADMANNYLGQAEGYRSSNRFLPDLISAEIGGATREAIAKLPDNLKLPSVMTPDELLNYAKKSASSFGLA